MIKQSLVLALVCLTLPAWAINKCTGADGRIVFQDMPCQGRGEKLNIRPTPINPPAPATEEANGTEKPLSDVERVKQFNAQAENTRKRQDIEMVLLPSAYAALNRHLATCEREYRFLQNEKGRATNNLAGATWEQSLSQEMSALATKCETQTRQHNSNIADIKRQCQKVGGCN